jgi:glycosyltransferase involved in cell wall biosynthesis
VTHPRVLLVVDATDLATAEETATNRWLRLLPLLESHGASVGMACLRGSGEMIGAVRDNGITAWQLSSDHRQFAIAIRRLGHLLRSQEFNVVQAHEVIPGLVSGLSRAYSNRALRIFFKEHLGGRRKLRMATGLAIRLSHLTTGPSRSAVEEVPESRLVPEISFAYNGVPTPRVVDPTELDGIRNELGIPTDAYVVGTVARLRPEKAIGDLIECMSTVASRVDRPVHLVIVGSGPEMSALKQIATRHRSFRSHFVGHKSDVAPWYALADVIAIPSLTETAPFAALEAMAASKPVVASQVGGLREFVRDCQTGFLVPPGDIPKLSTALLEVLMSSEKRTAMGHAGYERYQERFTIDRMAQGWVDLWRSALNH